MAEITVSDLISEDDSVKGVFDVFADKFKEIIQAEFQASRITPDVYGQVFITGYNQTLQQAIEFVLQKQQSDKQAELLVAEAAKVTKEQQYIDSQISLNTVQEDLVNAQVLQTQAETRRVDQQTANLVAELPLITANVNQTNASKLKIDAETSLLGQQELNAQKENLDIIESTKVKAAQVTYIGNQSAELVARTALIAEQTNNANKEGFRIDEQVDVLKKEVLKLTAETLNIPKQGLLIDAEASLKKAQADLVAQQEENALSEKSNIVKTLDKITAEIALLGAKKATEDANVNATAASESLVGKRIELLAAQIQGFSDDAAVKNKQVKASIFNVMRSTDDTLMPDASLYP